MGPVPRPLLALARAYRGGDGEGVAQGRPVDMPEFRAPLVTAAVEQVRPAERVGVCIDCGSPTRPSSNWPAIAPAHRAHQSSYFYRCPPCYVWRQLEQHQGGKHVQAAPSGHVRRLRGANGQGRLGARVQPAAVAGSRACPGVQLVFREWATSTRGVSDGG